MVEKNFILTDVMKTGNHIEIEEFVKFADVSNQSFDITGEWYKLHTYDLNKYNRLIALVDARLDYSFLQNTFYQRDLKERLDYLKNKGFIIIHANPWESKKATAEHFKTTNVWGGESSWFWHRMYSRYKNTQFNFYHTQKQYDFLYLNKTSRSHRELLFDQMNKRGLLSHCLYSCLYKKIPLPADYELLDLQGAAYPRYGKDRDIREKPYNETVYNIVSETTVHNEIFMTEKIWKPIIAEQIFIVHGKQGYLQDLRDLGFLTYNNHIDESYDSIESLEDRTRAIVDLCDSLKGRGHDQLYWDTENIREHNRKVFFSEEHCRSACRKTILGLLELADSSKISS